jgi:hypothetical protein
VDGFVAQTQWAKGQKGAQVRPCSNATGRGDLCRVMRLSAAQSHVLQKLGGAVGEPIQEVSDASLQPPSLFGVGMEVKDLLLQPAPKPFDRIQPRGIGLKRHNLYRKVPLRQSRLGRIRPLRGPRVLEGRVRPRPYLRLQFSKHVGMKVKRRVVLHNPQTLCLRGSNHLL